MTSQYHTIDQKKEIFAEKTRRMKESHIVDLELYVERLHANGPITKFINNNTDRVKIRIKFADFPCIELNGTYEEEFVALEAASMYPLPARSQDLMSESDFLRRGRTSLPPQSKSELKLKVQEIKSSLRESRGALDGEDTGKEGQKRTSIKHVTFDETLGSEDQEGRKEDDDSKEAGDQEMEGKGRSSKQIGEDIKQSTDKGQRAVRASEVDLSESTIVIKVDIGIPFNDCSSLIFTMTPQRLLYNLIKKPLRIYLIALTDEQSAILMGKTCLSLYQMSDVVAHMMSLEGGVHSISSMAGVYPLFEGNNESKEPKEIGQINIKIRIATYGISSCAKLCALEPAMSRVKFVSDEWTEDPFQTNIPKMERDVGPLTPIVTGEEHTPHVEMPQKQDEGTKLSFKCYTQMRDILQA